MKNKKKFIIATVATLLSAGLLATGGYFIYKHMDNKQIEQQKPTPDVPDTPGDEIPLTYEVTINIEGETTTQTVAVGGLVTFPKEPTKEGYKFLGYVVEGSEELINQETFIVTGNVTLVAVFKQEVAELSLFTISNNTITAYSGDKESLLLPSTYSLDEEENVIEGTDYKITGIRNGVFENCTRLKNITIPEGYTNIGSSTFKGCTNLSQITIPKGVTKIDGSLFDGCTNLIDVKLPTTITSIQPWAFRNCSNLIEVVIPEGVTSIGLYAFYGCNKLENISLPSTLTKIDQLAFGHCYALKSIDLPNNLTTIGATAFGSCTTLTELLIPAGVTSLGNDIVQGCSQLNKISMLGETPPTITSTTFSNYKNAVCVPESALTAYTTAWADYSIQVVANIEA